MNLYYYYVQEILYVLLVYEKKNIPICILLKLLIFDTLFCAKKTCAKVPGRTLLHGL